MTPLQEMTRRRLEELEAIEPGLWDAYAGLDDKYKAMEQDRFLAHAAWFKASQEITRLKEELALTQNQEKDKNMHISELGQSKFLKKTDIPDKALVTIRSVTKMNVAKESDKPELKWTVKFDELEKPMVLNSTNGQLIAGILGSESSDGWIGRQVVLYIDPNIMNKGVVVGGIRVRAPKNRPAPAPAQPSQYEAAAQRIIQQSPPLPKPTPPPLPEDDDGSDPF